MRKAVLLAAVLLALIVVPVALALRFTDDSYFVPEGKVGVAYSHWFKGDGGCGPALPYQFRLLAGALPPGLTLSKAGQVSGVPTQAGSSTFWVELSDQDPPEADWCRPAKSEREFTITIRPGDPPPPATTYLYWDLKAGATLLHAERAVTYADGTTGLGRMIRWMDARKGVIRTYGAVSLARVRR